MRILEGIAVSPGLAIARPFVLEREGRFCPLKRSISDTELAREIRLFRDALVKTAGEFQRSRAKLEQNLGAGHGALFDAYMLMLKDPLLVEAPIAMAREQHVNIAYAFYQTLQQFSKAFAGLGDNYLRERIDDIQAVGWQVLKNLVGDDRRALRAVRDGVVLLADDLSPSDTVDLPRDKVAGFATVEGSPTSHTAIVAQALELPALVAVTGLRDAELSEGTIILDGLEGKLILDPDEATLASYRRQQRLALQRRQELRKMRQLPAETPDGHRVSLMANLELPLEVAAAQNGGAEGIGLFRTEFLFLNRDTMPDEDEQHQWYRKVVRQMEPKPVVIRTLDLGGDKLAGPTGKVRETNPFLGLRGIRMCLANQKLFRTQLRAILRASDHGNVKLMFPLVSSVEEFRQASAVVEDVKSELKAARARFDPAIKVGVMIETPSAALIADQLAREAAFFSIGTNDLIQYAIAVDRGNQSTNYLYEVLHPAILRLLRMVINMAHAAQIEVTVCGEVAADPFAAVLLLGMGLDSFSVSPVSLSGTKRLVRTTNFIDAREVVQDALTLPTAQAVRELVRGRLTGRVTPVS